MAKLVQKWQRGPTARTCGVGTTPVRARGVHRVHAGGTGKVAKLGRKGQTGLSGTPWGGRSGARTGHRQHRGWAGGKGGASRVLPQLRRTGDSPNALGESDTAQEGQYDY